MKSFINDTLIPGICFVLFGCYSIFRRKDYGVAARRQNLKLWGFAATEKGYEISFLIGGGIFLIMGLLVLFKPLLFF
jgi:hypothetical protein